MPSQQSGQFRWSDLDGDEGFVDADVSELDEAEKEAGVIAVLLVNNGGMKASVYVTQEQAAGLRAILDTAAKTGERSS